MNKTTKVFIELIEASLILGIAGNLLLRTTPGINILLWILLLFTAMRALIFRWKPELWNSDSLALYATAVFFAAMFALFDSTVLLLLDGIAIITILGVMVMPSMKTSFRNSGTLNYFASLLTAGGSSVIGPLFVIIDDIKWSSLPKTALTKNLIAAAKGVAISVPLLAVIIGLLMSADAAFESLISQTFNIDGGTILINIGFSGIVAWGVLGYLRAVMSGIGYPADLPTKTKATPTAAKDASIRQPEFSVTEHTTEDPDRKEKPENASKTESAAPSSSGSTMPGFLKLGVVEISIILGLMNLVFLAFVIIQIPYLFGGMDLVQQTADFKLAEYARRGVGELVDVSFIVLPILLVMHWLINKEKPVAEKVFRVLASIQIGLLFVVMFSAVQRLLLLTGNLGYGMTTFRFYAMIMLIWLALVFVWFGMTVLRGKRNQFAYGALWSALFILGMVHFINPDAFIVKHNIDLMSQGRDFDAQYNVSLSADAAPLLIGALDKMAPEHQKVVINELESRDCEWGGGLDFRSWNWSRQRAVTVATTNGLRLTDSDCSDGL